jgi:hypothetical protein
MVTINIDAMEFIFLFMGFGFGIMECGRKFEGMVFVGLMLIAMIFQTFYRTNVIINTTPSKKRG